LVVVVEATAVEAALAATTKGDENGFRVVDVTPETGVSRAADGMILCTSTAIIATEEKTKKDLDHGTRHLMLEFLIAH
jgi:hypothetical protein